MTGCNHSSYRFPEAVTSFAAPACWLLRRPRPPSLPAVEPPNLNCLRLTGISYREWPHFSAPLKVIVASPAPTQFQSGAQRRRRTSSAAQPSVPSLNLQSPTRPSSTQSGASSGLPTGDFTQPLSTIPGTPGLGMSLSRSPSPRRGGGWSSPGLTNNYDNVSGKSSPRKNYGDTQMNGSARSSHGVTWESAQARSQEVNGYPSFSTRNNGFFARHARKISTSLPTFSSGARNFSDKEKLGRGRWLSPGSGTPARYLAHFSRMIWRFRLRAGIVVGLLMAFVLFYATRTFVAAPHVGS